MAQLYRADQLLGIEVVIATLDEEHPAVVSVHPSEAPYTDHVQDLPRMYNVAIPIDETRGQQTVGELTAWLLAARRVAVFIVEDDGTEHGPLSLGTWSESKTSRGRSLSLSLTERVEVTSQRETVPIAPSPRADVAAGTDEGDDDGDQATGDEPQASIARRAVDWARNALGLGGGE